MLLTDGWLAAAAHPDGPVGGPSPTGLPTPDPFGGLFTSGVVAFLHTVSDGFLHGVAAPLGAYLVHTPDLGHEPALRHVWLVALGCLFAMSAALLAVAATAAATGPASRLGRAAREAVGVRIVAGLLTAAVSLPLVALEVRVANVCAEALLPAGFTAATDPLLRATGTGGGSTGVATLVLVTVGVVLLVMLTLLALARWATLWLLVVLAPFAMGVAMLPGASDVARVWWRLQAATVALPVAYAALLATYAAMFAARTPGLTTVLSGVAVLVLMTKLPAWGAGLAVGAEVRDFTHPLRGAARRRARPLPH